MAVQVRTRRLVNPSRRRRVTVGITKANKAKFRAAKARKRYPNPAKKRKLSPKQIAIFGTPRQKAALRAKMRRTRNAGASSGSIPVGSKAKRAKYIPRGKNRAGHRSTDRPRQKRTKNVGEIVSISLAGLNPGKRRKNTGMARRKRRSNAAHKAHKTVRHNRRQNPSIKRRRRTVVHHKVAHRRRSNPIYKMRRINRGRRRPNPSMGSMTSGVLGKAIGVITGAIGARYLTQLALGSNNTSYMGYAGNLVAAFGLGYAAKKLTKSQEFATSVTVGGLVGVVLRVLQDLTPLGNYVNLSLQGAGKGGDYGLGVINNSSFFSPQVPVDGSMTSFITPSQTRSYVSSQLAQTAAMAKATGSKAGMGRMARTARAVI